MEQNILTTANNTFGLNLFKTVRNNLKGRNAILSPMSISAVLSMTQLGARGNTAQQMAKVLEWKEENGEKIHKLFQGFLISLQQASDQNELSTANKIFLEKTFTVLEEFKSKTKEWYLAEPVHANFIENVEEERAKINSWVEEQTQNRIKDLLTSGVLTPTTRMVLVNAVYFKGLWEKKFDKNSTSPRQFTLESGQTKEVPMMASKNVYGFYQDSALNFVAVELLYKGHDLSMIIILPNDVHGHEEMVAKFTPETLHTVIVNVDANREKIQLFLPTFEVSSSFLLKQPLSSLGMSDAFDTVSADFTGITGKRDLVLSEVVHRGFVKVNEEGTEAAAATGAVMMLRSLPLPVPVVEVNHPFLFVIIDKRVGGSMLFLGQVDDPSV